MHGIALALSCFELACSLHSQGFMHSGRSQHPLLKDSSLHDSSGDLNNEGHQIFRDLCSVTIFRFK